MTFNILRNSIVRNDLSCRHDNRDGFSVVWDENDNFRQYNDVSGLTTRVVWDRNYFSVSVSGTCYLGPETDQVPFEGGVYNLVKAVFRIEPDVSKVSPTTGRIQFQTSSDPTYDTDKEVDFSLIQNAAYNEYTVDMSQVKEWNGEITRVRLYPFVDGEAGLKIHLKSLKIQSASTFACDTIFNTPLCSRYSEYIHPCPWVGAGGFCEGSAVSDGIDIIENQNDELIVNINDFGAQKIRLVPVRGARLKDIARDLEEKLSNIGIGGYSGAKVEVNLSKLKITADDTREASSTVKVLDTSAARTLGFFDSLGNDLSTCVGGEEAATRYEPAGTIQLSKAEIAKLYETDVTPEVPGIKLNNRRYAVRAGREDFAEVYKDQKIDFTNKTIIDFNNPITNNGVITYLAYSGDGGAGTSFRFFRPRANGSLLQYAVVGAGITSNQVDKVFEQTTSVRVRKGDYVGIYDGKLDLGKIEELPNVSYFLYDGNPSNNETISAQQAQGRGDRGLRIFAHGKDTESEAVLVAEFEQKEKIEEITVVAEEEPQTEITNLSRAIVGGLNGGPFITGSTGVDKFGDPAPSLTDLGALTDGIKYNVPNAEAAHPSWLDGTIIPPDKFDQTEFSIILDFAKGTPVFFDIFKTVLYFRDTENIKYFGLEYPITTDEDDNLRSWGFVADTYTNVSLEGKPLLPKDHPLYSNPIRPTASEFIDSFQVLEYRILDFEFESVEARSLRYNVKNFFFEDDLTSPNLSNFELAVNPYILEIEVFAKSTPEASIADNFFFESSNDGLNYYLHTDFDVAGSTSADYLIGYPVKFLKLHIQPQSDLEIKGFTTTTSVVPNNIETNSIDGVVNLNVAVDDYSSSVPIEINNNSSSTQNYYIDIASQGNSVNRCILWNRMGSDTELERSEVGPGAAVKKRDDYYLREYNYALNVPAYVVDPFWLLNNNAQCYISYDHGSSWVSKGTTITDYNLETKLTSENPQYEDFLFTYVIVDLGNVYSLDTVQVVNPDGDPDFFNVSYSNKNVSDPGDLNIIDDFTGVKQDVRWIRLSGFSREAGDEINPPNTVSFLRLSLDVLNKRNTGKVPWISAPRLTNYVFGDNLTSGEGWQVFQNGFTNYYAVNLEDSFKITNVVIGPNVSSGFGTKVIDGVLVIDLDVLEPGDTGSLFEEDENFHEDLAFSNSQTEDISKVRWGSFGDPPGIKERWLLLRRESTIADEVMVHIEDNVQKDKPAFGNPRWWSALHGSVEKNFEIFQEDFHSISITYAASFGPNVEEIELQQSLGRDSLLSKRDYLRILFYISDVSQLDTTKGFFSLGRNDTEDNGRRDPLSGSAPDRTNYYQWNLSDVGQNISSGWNELLLPFSDSYKVGEPYFVGDNITVFPLQTSRFRWFKLNFSGKQDNEEFMVALDGIKIERAKFLPAKWGNGLYLSRREHVLFPLDNFNVFSGTIEFWLNPDWTKDINCNSCDSIRDHTIFRFYNSDSFVLAAFMTGSGLKIYLTDGNRQYTLTDNSLVSMFAEQNTHVAVVWDLLEINREGVFSVFINGELSSVFEDENFISTDFVSNPNTNLLLGGIGWAGLISDFASSVDGVVDNLKVYNYDFRDFEHSLNNEGLQYIRPSDELIEISLDNSEFFGNDDRGSGLPLLASGIAPGAAFKVYIRNKENTTGSNFTGQERTSYLQILRTSS